MPARRPPQGEYWVGTASACAQGCLLLQACLGEELTHHLGLTLALAGWDGGFCEIARGWD